MTLFDFFTTRKQLRKDEQEEASPLSSLLQLEHEIYVQHILCLLVSSSSAIHHFVDGNFTAFFGRLLVLTRLMRF